MGKDHSKLSKEDYVITKQDKHCIIATKGDDSFFIKMIDLNQKTRKAVATFTSEIETLQRINHPHIVNMKNSFRDENENVYYVVMDRCQGGSLADKIEMKSSESLQESQILSWIAEVCMALKAIHEAALYHKDLTSKNVLLTDFGLVCLGGFGNIHENSKHPSNTNPSASLNYVAPEVITGGTYDAKSDIWSVGCILLELCTKERAFSSENLIPTMISGACPTLPNTFSPELGDLLSDLLNKDPQQRPTASEILACPFVLQCLTEKCKTTVADLQTKLEKLRILADGLERVHQGATIGRLTGGVMGAMGGITSIVGLILAPFTLGASLIVTGVGVGVGAVGGITAGASNITNMVNQTSDRRAIRSMIREFEQKTSAVVTWLLEINSGLQTISSHCPQTPETDGNFREENLKRLGFKAGKGIIGIGEVIRLARVVNVGNIAAQAVHAAKVATGVFSGLFVAVDIFFIAMDAKEIHHIKEAKEAERRYVLSSGSRSKFDDRESFDKNKLLLNSEMQECDPTETSETDPSAPNTSPVTSEIMRFVQSVRNAADKLEEVLKELKTIVSSIPSLLEENNQGSREMELM